jgi:hypothetical protein
VPFSFDIGIYILLLCGFVFAPEHVSIAIAQIQTERINKGVDDILYYQEIFFEPILVV